MALVAADGGEKKKTIIDKALDGSADATEFKDFIASFIKDQNNLNLRSTNCRLSRTSLDFSNDGNLVPVTPYNEMDVSERYVSDVITIENQAKKRGQSVYFEVCCKPNTKFKLLVDQPHGCIKKNSKVSLTFKLQVFCTTKVYQMMKITLSKEKPRTRKERLVPGEFYTATSETDESSASELGRLWIAFKIESELSNQIDWDEIKVGDRIAKGGFGTVFKGTWRGSEVAVKLLNTQELVDEEKDMVKREMVLMSRLASPHMVTYMGSTLLKGQPWSIIMEYVSGGSLTDMLNKCNDRMSLRFKIKLLMDIVAGMTYLHSHSIYHRDIKPDNMLVVSQHETGVNLKITDFGTSKASTKKGGLSTYQMFDFQAVQEKAKTAAAEGADILQKLNQQQATPDERRVTRGVGTLIYQAPEILEGSDHLQIDKTDVYAFGLLMWEVFTAVEPYSQGPTSKFSKWDLEAHVKAGNRPEIPASMPKGYKDIMEKCWHQNADDRPDFQKIQEELRALFAEQNPDEELGVARVAQPRARAAVAAAVVAKPAGPAGVRLNDRGVPVPIGPVEQIGWGEDIGRPEAEARLGNSKPGTFIIRWSANTRSYVLTYSKGARQYQHIAYILPVPPELTKIQVDKEDGKRQSYEDIFDYVRAMKESGIITTPCVMQSNENLYSHSPGT